MKTLCKASLSVLIAGSSIAPLIGAAQAQQYNRPWGFDQQNRAQMAVVMRQMEGGDSGSVSGTGGSSGTTIVCGGGSATATANNTCIILNNSTGQIETDQLSDGDQAASNSSSTAINGETESDADEILSTLNAAE